MSIRQLNDYVGTAETLSDFFGPEDCKAGETLVRRGWVKCKSEGRVETILAYCADDGILSVQAWTRRDGEWKFEQGGNSTNATEAIQSVINGTVHATNCILEAGLVELEGEGVD